jgi:mannosyltransferase OCH1-like enzyme
VYAIYAAYPLAVMRADFWRLAVLYAHGGIYADVDTKCLTPVQHWFPPRVTSPQDPRFVINASTWQAAGPLQYFNLTWDDCSLVAALENDAHVCQWIIAAAAGHPVLRSAMQIALESMRDGFDCTYEHMVHAHTGPAVWTQAIADVLGLDRSTSAHDITVAAWTNAAVYQRARQLRVCIVAPTFWGAPFPYNTTAQNAQNLYSSQWGRGAPNTPWVKERQHVIATARRSLHRPA